MCRNCSACAGFRRRADMHDTAVAKFAAWLWQYCSGPRVAGVNLLRIEEKRIS
jgi:hypothetical protein